MEPTNTVTSSSPSERASDRGHAAHTRSADSQDGLKGSFLRPINVTFLGAGSHFCPTLCRDVITVPGNRGGTFRLVDTDVDRLGVMHRSVEQIIRQAGAEKMWSVRSSANRREVLRDTDYAICCVEVSGPQCVDIDYDIPLKYGIDQCIGDTIGPGGLFKGLRTIPVFLDILRDMAELCPKAIMLNYTNPMNMMCLAAGRACPEISVVGLCHSIQHTSHQLADYAGVPYDEMRWDCAGINHMAWFTRLEHKGKDLYDSVLHDKFRRELKVGIDEANRGLASHDNRDRGESQEDTSGSKDLVRKDMCVRFGAFITETSGHLSEYLPYYRKSEEGRKLLRPSYDGGSRFYASNWPSWRKEADARRKQILSGDESESLDRSWEFASWIIEAIEKDVPYRIHGNVMNSDSRNYAASRGEAGKLITNLPGDGCVEVACLVDGNGILPTRYGALPPQMAHHCASNMACFDLGATAAIERSMSAAAWALMHDPLTAAILTPGEIEDMTVELFDAQKDYLDEYK